MWRIIFIALAFVLVMLASPVRAEPVHRVGSSIIAGSTYFAGGVVWGAGQVAQFGWAVATAPLRLFAPPPRYYAEPPRKRR